MSITAIPDSVHDHDALEFPSGEIVLLTSVCRGQRARVLQLPVEAKAATPERGIEADYQEATS